MLPMLDRALADFGDRGGIRDGHRHRRGLPEAENAGLARSLSDESLASPPRRARWRSPRYSQVWVRADNMFGQAGTGYAKLKFLCDGWFGQMEPVWRGSWRVAAGFALLLTGVCAAGHAAADPGPRAYPGMEIRQGTTTCTLGFVETRLRMAMTTGNCDGDSTVTDSRGDVIGTVQLVRRNTADDGAAYGSIDGVEYEVIRLAPNVSASDLLPTGRELQSVPDVQAQLALPVCHFGISTGQKCGRVSSVGNGRLVIPDLELGGGDVGGPVYALTDDNRAVIVGLLEDTTRPVPEAESWQAVMQQLYVDLRTPNSQPPSAQQPAPGGQMI